MIVMMVIITLILQSRSLFFLTQRELMNRAHKLNRAFQLVASISKKYKFKPNAHVFTNLIQARVSNRQLATSCQAFGAAKKMNLESPLLQPWTGPHGGVPPWDLVRSEEFVPAFDAAIEESNNDINAITNNAAEPSFENTIAWSNS